MSYPNDAPAAAWYPDPQMPGRVRWWDGTNWTEHVSAPANPMQADQIAIEAAGTWDAVTQAATTQAAATQAAGTQAAATQAAVPQAAATWDAVAQAAVPQIAEADAALAAADAEHAAADPGAQQGFIGRHAAGAEPAPRQAPRVPQIRPRQRTAVLGESLQSA